MTPDDTRAGTTETFTSEAGYPSAIFYVSVVEFEQLSQKLESLADQFAGIHDALPVSKIPDPLARFLVDRVVPSGQLSTYALRLLGR